MTTRRARRWLRPLCTVLLLALAAAAPAQVYNKQNSGVSPPPASAPSSPSNNNRAPGTAPERADAPASAAGSPGNVAPSNAPRSPSQPVAPSRAPSRPDAPSRADAPAQAGSPANKAPASDDPRSPPTAPRPPADGRAPSNAPRHADSDALSPTTPADTRGRLAADIAALAPQRPGHVDLYVLGIAGDGSERVFENEVRHLENLAAQRLDAAGRVLTLANHPPRGGLRPLPAADPDSIAAALAGLGKVMDRDEDVLLLYVTTHGTEDHQLLLRRPGQGDRLLEPEPLRKALDASGIRHRVLVISACFSGGFAKALNSPDTLLLMAARRDRPSFGCGNDSAATYFGRAWLVDALNTTVDIDAAFRQAAQAIEKREVSEGRQPSLPQANRGANISATLAAWRAGFTPGPAVPYPHADPVEAPRPPRAPRVRPADERHASR